MPSFYESDLLFHFPDDWIVRKFDDTAAYQSLSGHGLKGVDFIALSPDGKLWLIEVKNYRPRFKNTREYYAKRRTPAALGHHVWSKFRDSQRLLAIVMASLERKWWFTAWNWFRRWFPNPNSNYWFWLEAQHRAEALACCYVLWLETPEGTSDYNEAVAAQLTAALPPNAQLWVVEAEDDQGIPFRVGTSGG